MKLFKEILILLIFIACKSDTQKISFLQSGLYVHEKNGDYSLLKVEGTQLSLGVWESLTSDDGSFEDKVQMIDLDFSADQKKLIINPNQDIQKNCLEGFNVMLKNENSFKNYFNVSFINVDSMTLNSSMTHLDGNIEKTTWKRISHNNFNDFTREIAGKEITIKEMSCDLIHETIKMVPDGLYSSSLWSNQRNERVSTDFFASEIKGSKYSEYYYLINNPSSLAAKVSFDLVKKTNGDFVYNLVIPKKIKDEGCEERYKEKYKGAKVGVSQVSISEQATTYTLKFEDSDFVVNNTLFDNIHQLGINEVVESLDCEWIRILDNT